MRAYFFGNFYLSQIQQGIQAAHALARLVDKYRFDEKANMIFDWIANHETMILLNGGDMQALEDLKVFFATDENPYPWAAFQESRDALAGATTSVSILLPEKIYEGAQTRRRFGLSARVEGEIEGDWVKSLKETDEKGNVVFEGRFTRFESLLLDMLPNYRLA